MKNSVHLRNAGIVAFKTLSGLALIATAMSASASENYRSRQSPVGVFGGEIAASIDNPGLFGTAALTYIKIDKVVDGDGNDISLPAVPLTPLPTGVPTRGLVPNGTYALKVQIPPVNFQQTQTQLNLFGGYLTESTYADGRIAFAVNVPLIQSTRSVTVQPVYVVTPTPTAGLPPALRGAITSVAGAVQAGVQARLAGTLASQNTDVSGMGDTELSAVWVRHQNRLKIAAGVSLFVPTGSYDKARGPNPGFGDFYTIRPGVAVTYSLNPDHTDSAWDSGVTVAGRLSYGINSTNKATDYRSGNFVYAEAAIAKVMGNWALGANLLTIQQVTDDSGSGVAVGGNRLKNNSFGPFISYKLPGKDAGFNLNYSQNFGGQNTQLVKSLQLRFIKSW